MAVTAIPIGIEDLYFIGLNGDTKPTIASHPNVPKPEPGSKFFEYDTGDTYITYDGTNWVAFENNQVLATTGAITGPTIGATTTAALAANPNRKVATFVNDSDEAIYLAFGVSAVMNKGIRLNASGGSYEINATNMFRGAVNAICASGSKVLCVQELD